MNAKEPRVSVDLSAFPDLVVIYLGFRVSSPRGIPSLMRLSRGLVGIARDKPEGLLRHEFMAFGLLHPGFRQYWRDLESLERFTRAEPHRGWWSAFLRDPGGGGFWHETYRIGGGMEAIYLNMPPLGLGGFAPAMVPQGPFMTARQRLSA